MFAAVMRKAGVPKQLECHGFVCDSPEEAILVAANLYQALLETMKRNKRPNSSSQVRTLVVSEKKRQVSELHLGVTAGNHSSSSSANPVSAPIVWSRVKAASLLLDCRPHEWSKGPRAALSGQGVRTGWGCEGWQEELSRRGVLVCWCVLVCRCAGVLRKARGRVVSAGGFSPAGSDGARRNHSRQTSMRLPHFALQRLPELAVGGGKNYFLPLSSHLHSKLVSVCSCSFQWNALSLTRPGFTQPHFSG